MIPADDNNKHIKEDSERGEAGTSLPEKRRGRKKRKRSAAAADEIDALFDDAIGRKVVWSALEPAAAHAKAEETNDDLALKLGKGQQGDQSVDHRHAELGAVIDAMKAEPRSGGKKGSKRRLGPT